MSLLSKMSQRTTSSLTLAVIFILGFFYFSQGSFIYFPPDVPSEGKIEKMTEGYIKVTVETSDGYDLDGYFRPPRDSRIPVIFAFHGNSALAVDMTNTFAHLAERGYGVFLPEYRGYGGNPGTPSEEGLYNDADAFYKWIKDHPDYSGNPLVVYGQSLGTGVAVDIASRVGGDGIAGLILEVPFLSVVDVVASMYPHVPFLSFFVDDKYFSDKKIGKITVPKLFLLAGQDEVVGVDGGKKLFALAQQPKTLKIYDRATHNAIYAEGAADDIESFLKEEIGGLE